MNPYKVFDFYEDFFYLNLYKVCERFNDDFSHPNPYKSLQSVCYHAAARRPK